MFRNFKALKRVINIDQNTLAVSFSDKDFTLTHEMKRQKFQDPVTETSISWMKNHSQNIFHNSHTTDYDIGKNPTFGDIDPSLRTTREPTNVFYDTDGFSTSYSGDIIVPTDVYYNYYTGSSPAFGDVREPTKNPTLGETREPTNVSYDTDGVSDSGDISEPTNVSYDMGYGGSSDIQPVGKK